MQPAPAEPGIRLTDVDTPALVVDLTALEHNIEHMAREVARSGVRLRPHAKSHKCAEIARRQLAAGAVGICCQKVSEAQALVDAGISDVLISNQVVVRRKIDRLVALAERARVGVCVDDAQNVRALSRAARRRRVELAVLVEIDVGAARCGVPPGARALALAREVERAPNLRFEGLQAYHGRAQHLREHAERRSAIADAVTRTRGTMKLLRGSGLECTTIAGGGTGTFELEAESGVYNELQAGSYVFMDADYARNLAQDGAPVNEFRHSLFVLSTVMSASRPGRAVVDAGLKSMAFDSGPPSVQRPSGARYLSASDEHGRLDVSACEHPIGLGDQVTLIPGHCDPTVNLHDWLVAARDGVVEAVWPIEARGAVF